MGSNVHGSAHRAQGQCFLPLRLISCFVHAQELGLPEDPDVPMLGFIGRLDFQKGVDLIHESFDWMMSQGYQLVMLGSGRQDLENSLK